MGNFTLPSNPQQNSLHDRAYQIWYCSPNTSSSLCCLHALYYASLMKTNRCFSLFLFPRVRPYAIYDRHPNTVIVFRDTLLFSFIRSPLHCLTNPMKLAEWKFFCIWFLDVIHTVTAGNRGWRPTSFSIDSEILI